MDASIGSITTEDLKTIREMLEKSLREGVEENSDNNLDVAKFVDQVENEIRKKIEIVFPQADQNKVQELKDSVEKMELKAQRMKNQLLIHRNRFIEDVRSNIEAELNSKLPFCNEIDIDQPISLSEEDQKNLAMLDQQIETLEQIIKNAEMSSEKLPKLEKFADDTQKRLSKN